MNAQVLAFPKTLTVQPPMTERQIRHERMAELIVQRSRRKGMDISIEQARAALTRAILEIRR